MPFAGRGMVLIFFLMLRKIRKIQGRQQGYSKEYKGSNNQISTLSSSIIGKTKSEPAPGTP
jgi:hypothetical protein